MHDKSENICCCGIWLWITLGWCYSNELETAPLVHLSHTSLECFIIKHHNAICSRYNITYYNGILIRDLLTSGICSIGYIIKQKWLFFYEYHDMFTIVQMYLYSNISTLLWPVPRCLPSYHIPYKYLSYQISIKYSVFYVVCGDFTQRLMLQEKNRRETIAWVLPENNFTNITLPRDKQKITLSNLDSSCSFKLFLYAIVRGMCHFLKFLYEVLKFAQW